MAQEGRAKRKTIATTRRRGSREKGQEMNVNCLATKNPVRSRVAIQMKKVFEEISRKGAQMYNRGE